MEVRRSNKGLCSASLSKCLSSIYVCAHSMWLSEPLFLFAYSAFLLWTLHWSQCLYPPPSAMVLPLAHRMMHLLTVLSLSQGCVSLGKVSSKILDGVFCNFTFYFLNALITWFALDPRTINFCTDHEKCCHFVFIQHI